MSQATLTGFKTDAKVSKGGVFRQPSDDVGSGASPAGAHRHKRRKHEQKRVQIKCPVGSPHSLIVPRKVEVNTEYARSTFNMFDRKRVGYFLHKDVRRVFADSPEGHYNEFLSRFDANNDGKVEWDEFLSTMNDFIGQKGDLNFCERVYITLSEPDSSKLAKVFSVIIMILIFVSTLSFVVDSVPRFHSLEWVAPGEACPGENILTGQPHHVDTCSEYMVSQSPTMEPTLAPTWPTTEPTMGPTLSCNNDDGLAWQRGCCPCPPSKHPMFELVEMVCIVIFSLEYMSRLCTAWAARFGEKFEIVLDVVSVPQVKNPAFSRTWAYVANTMNLIDFFAIIPFYIDMLNTSGALPLGFLRVLRLARVFRVFKMGKYSKGMSLLSNVLINSAPALQLLCFFSLIGMILFGSMIFFCEQGKWMVTEDWPEGEYLRPDITGNSFEPSPFVSIPSCFWWVIVTQTTVGYGDQYPVTDMGKVVGSFCMVSGILVLALPITIIGANFANEYAKVQAEEARERMELKTELAEDAAHAAAEAAEAAAQQLQSMKSGITQGASSFVGGMGKNLGLGGRNSKVSDATGQEVTSDPVTPLGASPHLAGSRTMFDSRASDVEDSDSEDEEDMDMLRMTKVRNDMNRKSSDLNLMIRDYIESSAVSQKASAAMLDEVTELLELLDDDEIKHIDSDKTMAMVNLCWAWLKKCDDDPVVVTSVRQRELLLRAVMEFAVSTVGLLEENYTVHHTPAYTHRKMPR